MLDTKSTPAAASVAVRTRQWPQSTKRKRNLYEFSGFAYEEDEQVRRSVVQCNPYSSICVYGDAWLHGAGGGCIHSMAWHTCACMTVQAAPHALRTCMHSCIGWPWCWAQRQQHASTS